MEINKQKFLDTLLDIKDKVTKLGDKDMDEIKVDYISFTFKKLKYTEEIYDYLTEQNNLEVDLYETNEGYGISIKY